MISTNFPEQLTSFIGRKKEVADLVRLVQASRLVTVTGTAGCGKTRLAVQAAAKVSRRYPDGILWVELVPLDDPHLIPRAVAKKLDVTDLPERALVDGIVEALQGRQILLVLDNCEHLLPACSQLAETLLRLTGINILATSREALGLISEVHYPLSPMTAPPAGLSIEAVRQFDSPVLFVERARAVLPGFNLTPENIDAVTSICRQLDGIPLAIELASARINVLTVEQINSRLGDRYRLQDETLFTGAGQHRSLRTALDWSYDLLNPSEQAVLRRLSVFDGGCSLDTAEEVCAGEGVERPRMLELLSSLISKSLLTAQTLQRSEARYSLLQTIRQYGREKLAACGEMSAVCDRHLGCMLRLTAETLPKLNGPYQQLWLNWLEGESDNIRAALSWALESRQVEAGLRIAIAIYQFWTIRDYAEEGLAWLERLTGLADEQVAPVIHANALAYGVFLAGFRRNTAAQIEFGQKAALLGDSLGSRDKPALHWALSAQAYAAQAAGNELLQYELANQAIQLNREMGNSFQLGLTLSFNSFTAMSLARYAEAHAMLDEALPLLREAGNPYRIAMALNFSGDLARCEQDYPRAESVYLESISMLRKLDAPRDLASALQNLGHTCLHMGETGQARTLFGESLSIQQTHGNTPGTAECLIGYAALACAFNLPAQAARLLAAAVVHGGQRFVSTWAATRLEYEHCLSLAGAGLTEAQFQAEQAAGRALSLEQAVSLAQNLPLRLTAARVRANGPADLTARECEIAGLIASGKTNGEIADELVLSKRTIEKHIAHILVKLGAANRAQVVRWALDAGLAKPSI